MITAGLYRNRLIANCITFLAAVVLSFAASHSAQSAQDPLRKLLSERLWNKRDAYDASHVLMVPMHAAYASGNDNRVAEFRRFGRLWLADPKKPYLGRLTNRQFDYFMTRLAYLEMQSTHCGEFSALLYEYLNDRTAKNIKQPAWNWQMEPFSDQISRIAWKASQAATEPTYLKAIFDEDLFSVSTAADLTSMSRICGWQLENTVEQMAGLGLAAILDQGEFIEDG